MALATQCPHCHTVFRVAHDQLKLRGGIVRCGACNEIFDGNAALIEPALPPLPAAAPDTPLDIAPVASSGSPDPNASLPEPPDLGETSPDSDLETAAEALANSGIEPDGAQPAFQGVSLPAGEAAMAYQPSLPPDPGPAQAPPPETEDSDFDLPSEHIVAVALDDVHSFDEPSPEPAPEPVIIEDDAQNADRIADDAAAAELLTGAPEGALLAAGAGAVAADEARQEDEPEFIRQANRREHLGRNARVVMQWGTPLLALLLLLQIGTTFRNPLAARYPALAPALSALCAPFGCKVELPMQIDTLAIEQGELQTLSDNTFSFATVLRNGSRTAQAWPHIELVLNDAADKPVLRRVFAPRDYLGNPADVKPGFRPRSEQPVKLYFELNRLKASGYHIAIFYP